jgi:hypothetical protein
MSDTSKKSRSLLSIMLLLSAATIAGLALAEGLLRIIEARRSSLEISYEALQGYSTIDLGSLNYNDMQVNRKKESGTYRLLSFGDSFAFTIVKPEHTYHNIAARLASRISGKRVRLVNLGEPMVSFTQYRNAYDVWGRLLEHDGAVFNIYLGNDLLDISYGWVQDDVELNRLFLHMDRDQRTGAARHVGIPSKFPLRLMDYGYAVYLTSTGAIRSHPPSPQGPYNFALSVLDEQTWLGFARPQLDNFDPKKLGDLKKGYMAVIRFARFLQELEKEGKFIVVLLSPTQLQVDGNPLDRTLKAFSREKGELDMDLSAYLIQRIFAEVAPNVPLLYLRPILRCAAKARLETYYQNDTHWSAEGNQIVGEFLGLWLARNLGDSKMAVPKNVHQCTKGGLRYGSSPPLTETPQRTAAYVGTIRPLMETTLH